MASVLLVEDEVFIRIMIADMVKELGHVVAAEAGNIEAGCDLAENGDWLCRSTCRRRRQPYLEGHTGDAGLRSGCHGRYRYHQCSEF